MPQRNYMKYSGMPMGMWLLLKNSFEKNLVNAFGLTKEEAKTVRLKAKPKYRKIIEFHDGRNTERIIEHLKQDGVI